MGALILDASVLIGLLDSADAHHEAAVDDVEAADLRSTGLLAPASAYSEALVSFARAGRVSQARDAIAGMGITVTPLTAAIGERAAQLRAAHDRLRLPDAIVLATARVLGAELLTYDDHLACVSRMPTPVDPRTSGRLRNLRGARLASEEGGCSPTSRSRSASATESSG